MSGCGVKPFGARRWGVVRQGSCRSRGASQRGGAVFQEPAAFPVGALFFGRRCCRMVHWREAKALCRSRRVPQEPGVLVGIFQEVRVIDA